MPRCIPLPPALRGGLANNSGGISKEVRAAANQQKVLAKALSDVAGVLLERLDTQGDTPDKSRLLWSGALLLAEKLRGGAVDDMIARSARAQQLAARIKRWK